MKRKIGLIIVFILLVSCICLIVFKDQILPKEKTKKEQVKIVDSIKDYDYKLSENATEVYKKEFKNLKKILEEDSIDFTKYANSLSKLFIMDLYTLKNKTNKYDVTSVQFIYPDKVDNYILNVEDTLYKYIEDNYDGKRTQVLPEVKSVTINNIEQTSYTLEKEKFEAYKVTLNWEYTQEEEYDSNGTLYLIKKDNYLYVIEKNDEYEIEENNELD